MRITLPSTQQHKGRELGLCTLSAWGARALGQTSMHVMEGGPRDAPASGSVGHSGVVSGCLDAERPWAAPVRRGRGETRAEELVCGPAELVSGMAGMRRLGGGKRSVNWASPASLALAHRGFGRCLCCC